MENISEATKKNWKRLNVNEKDKKLDSRANKTNSQKQIIPTELFINKANVEKVKLILEKIKEIKEKQEMTLKEIMHSFSMNYLNVNGLIDENLDSNKRNVQNILNEYKEIKIINEVYSISLPENEIDILGIIYQCLQKEGSKNKKGSYYTPLFIVEDMIKNITNKENKKILDPCCGTGMFLIGADVKDPTNLYGYDNDEIALEIAKVNLIVKYKDIEFEPKIEKKDFFNEKIDDKFDCIITNPPWGAKNFEVNMVDYYGLRSNESFAYALYKSMNIIAKNGQIIFLLPESFLNVKTHADIRRYILDNVSIEKIYKYNNIFSGVITKFVGIILQNKETKNKRIKIFDLGKEYFEDIEDVLKSPNNVITSNVEIDKEIIKKIYSRPYETLKNSEWGIGIVTGNNKEKLVSNKQDGFEKIYTGKEVSEYNLLPCKNYVKYNREEFQQCAPDKLYRAKEKFIYKFISKRLVFAYDNAGSLVLNSANILIPKFKKVQNKVALALLNSMIFKYLYMKKFGEIKILRGNLEQLPFTLFEDDVVKRIEDMVNLRLKEQITDNEIDNYLFEVYSLNNDEIEHIKDVVK